MSLANRPDTVRIVGTDRKYLVFIAPTGFEYDPAMPETMSQLVDLVESLSSKRWVTQSMIQQAVRLTAEARGWSAESCCKVVFSK